MKEWISENKYLATLIGICSGLSIVFGYLIYSQAGVEKLARTSLAAKHGKIAGYRKELGNPDQVNADNLNKAVNEGLSLSIDLYDKLAVSGDHQFDFTRSATDFATLLEKYIDSAKSNFKGANVMYPEDSWFGFEKYRESLIKQNDKAIGLCLYQQDAFTTLFQYISSLGPCTLNSIYREPVEEENQDFTPEPTSFEAVRNMRFDLVVTLNEKQLSDLLEKLANSSDHLFVVKCISFKNENISPISIPEIMEGNTDTSAEDDDNGFDFSASGEDEEEEGEQMSVADKRELRGEIEPDTMILDQILGSEKLTVAISMDLVLVTKLDKLKIKRSVQK